MIGSLQISPQTGASAGRTALIGAVTSDLPASAFRTAFDLAGETGPQTVPDAASDIKLVTSTLDTGAEPQADPAPQAPPMTVAQHRHLSTLTYDAPLAVETVTPDPATGDLSKPAVHKTRTPADRAVADQTKDLPAAGPVTVLSQQDVPLSQPTAVENVPVGVRTQSFASEVSPFATSDVPTQTSARHEAPFGPRSGGANPPITGTEDESVTGVQTIARPGPPAQAIGSASASHALNSPQLAEADQKIYAEPTPTEDQGPQLRSNPITPPVADAHQADLAFPTASFGTTLPSKATQRPDNTAILPGSAQQPAARISTATSTAPKVAGQTIPTPMHVAETIPAKSGDAPRIPLQTSTAKPDATATVSAREPSAKPDGTTKAAPVSNANQAQPQSRASPSEPAKPVQAPRFDPSAPPSGRTFAPLPPVVERPVATDARPAALLDAAGPVARTAPTAIPALQGSAQRLSVKITEVKPADAVLVKFQPLPLVASSVAPILGTIAAGPVLSDFAVHASINPPLPDAMPTLQVPAPPAPQEVMLPAPVPRAHADAAAPSITTRIRPASLDADASSPGAGQHDAPFETFASRATLPTAPQPAGAPIRLPQGPIPQVDSATAELSAPDPIARTAMPAIPFSILTPAQAMSRFQTMLEHASRQTLPTAVPGSSTPGTHASAKKAADVLTSGPVPPKQPPPQVSERANPPAATVIPEMGPAEGHVKSTTQALSWTPQPTALPLREPALSAPRPAGSLPPQPGRAATSLADIRTSGDRAAVPQPVMADARRPAGFGSAASKPAAPSPLAQKIAPVPSKSADGTERPVSPSVPVATTAPQLLAATPAPTAFKTERHYTQRPTQPPRPALPGRSRPPDQAPGRISENRPVSRGADGPPAFQSPIEATRPFSPRTLPEPPRAAPNTSTTRIPDSAPQHAFADRVVTGESDSLPFVPLPPHATRPALPNLPLALPDAPPVSAAVAQAVGVAPAPDTTDRMALRRLAPQHSHVAEPQAARGTGSPPEIVSKSHLRDLPTAAFQRAPMRSGPVASDPVSPISSAPAEAPQPGAATVLHQALPAQPTQLRTADTAHGPAMAAPDHASHTLPKGFSTTLARAIGDTGHSRTELILEPAELGRVRFDMVTQGDRVQINLSVERPETLTLMRNHAEELRQEFRDAGFAGSTLNFSQWGQQGEGKALHEWAEDAAALQDPMTAPTDAPPTPRPRTPADGLDIRL